MDGPLSKIERMCSGSRRSAEVVVPLVIEMTRARAVADLGCGRGDWLAVFADHGGIAILGVDGPWIPVEELQIPRDSFVRFDLRSPFRCERTFDLAISLEVAEHLPPASADVFLDSLVRLAPIVLFSAAIPGQGGLRHLNEQWPDYWIGRFRQRDYVAIDCVRPRIWSLSDVEWWYCQNTLLFVAEDYLKTQEYLRDLAAKSPPPLPLVHPRLFEEVAARPSIHSLRQVLRALPSLFAKRAASRVTRLLDFTRR